MAYTLADSLVRASIPAIVLTVFAVARRYLPAKSAKEFGTAYSIDELSARFAFTQLLVGAGMVAIGAVIVWGTHTLLVSVNQLFVSLEGPSDFVLLPQTAIWWFLPGFAAITLAWEATLGTWSLMGNKNEVALYNYWTTAKAGFDSTRILRIMAVAIVLPIAILTALALPEHAVMQKDAIHARGYGFSSARAFRYVDARRMTVIDGFRQRDGKLVKRAGIVLDFVDGRRWSSADISNFEPSVDPELLNYIRSKTGLEPQYVEAESDIPERNSSREIPNFSRIDRAIGAYSEPNTPAQKRNTARPFGSTEDKSRKSALRSSFLYVPLPLSAGPDLLAGRRSCRRVS